MEYSKLYITLEIGWGNECFHSSTYAYSRTPTKWLKWSGNWSVFDHLIRWLKS